MDDKTEKMTTVKKSRSAKDDRVDVIRILVVMAISFLLGFGLVIAFFKNSPPSTEDSQGAEAAPDTPEEENGSPVADTSDASPEASGYAPSGGYAPADTPKPVENDHGDEGGDYNEGDAPPVVPPGRTPEGVFVEGEPFYLKCWDSNGSEIAGASCDHLNLLEKRFSTRVYVVDKCKQKYTPSGAVGKLSLGMEVDFDKRSLNFWSGASSDLDSAQKVATCLREELAGLPINGVEHKNNRYRIFFTVKFGDSEGKPAKAPAAGKKLTKGKIVKVIKDRVRVRKEPVDGAIIGKISSGNQVKLIKKKGEWCNIVTPNNNEGWMTCEALSP